MLLMPKSFFLSCISVLFFSSFYQTIFSENKKVDRINSDRIAYHIEKIKKDFELHERQERLAHVLRIAFMVTLASATYIWFSRYYVSETDKALLTEIKKNLVQQEQNKIIQATSKVTNSVVSPAVMPSVPSPNDTSTSGSNFMSKYLSNPLLKIFKRSNASVASSVSAPSTSSEVVPPSNVSLLDSRKTAVSPQESLMRSSSRSLLRTSREYSLWILGILSSSTVSWLGTRAISSIDTRFEALIAERTTKWFISHSTLLNETLRQLKHVGLILEPNQKFMNEFTLDLDVDVHDGEFSQELSRIKLFSQVLNARHEDQLELRKLYSQKLIALVQQWVFDIEKLIAFIHVSFAVDTYAVHVLERETLQLCDLIEGYLAQGNNQKVDFGLVPSIFKAALQLDHVVSHLLFERQNEMAKSAALI